MSRKRKKPNSIGGQFAPRLIEMLESPAYRALSLSARRVLERIEIELAQHGGQDNGGLPVTYDDFERYGIRIGFGAANNLLKEYWPTIFKRLRIAKVAPGLQP